LLVNRWRDFPNGFDIFDKVLSYMADVDLVAAGPASSTTSARSPLWRTVKVLLLGQLLALTITGGALFK
jgi:zona occludens toxin (predicted ATPase)